MKVTPKLTPQTIERTIEAMNVIYLCSQMIEMAWMINRDVKFANPNMNNFNKKIKEHSASIMKSLNCNVKDMDMAEERAIELYRSINFLSQYSTEDLIKFNDLVEKEIINKQHE